MSELSSASFLITPPDSLIGSNKNYNITLIDLGDSDIDQIFEHCKTSAQCYNLYNYQCNMQNIGWLMRSIEISDAVIINVDKTSESYIKHLLLYMSKTYYYGENIATENINKLAQPIEFFEKIKGKKNVSI